MVKVFISCAREGLEDYWRAAIVVCNELGWVPLHMDFFAAMGTAPTEGCKEKLDEADVYVGIIAHRYGSIPAGKTRSFTEIEFDYAGDRGIEQLCFLVEEDYPWPPENRDDENQAELKQFKERIARQATHDKFNTPASLRACLYKAFIAWAGKRLNQLSTLPQLMAADPAVRAAISLVQPTRARTTERIRLLNAQKAAHDLLQRLQAQCYDPVAGEAKRFPLDEAGIQTLERSQRVLCYIIEELRHIAASDPAGDYSWVGRLEEAHGYLRRTIATSDPVHREAAIHCLRQVLDLQLSGVNNRLKRTAGSIDLAAVIGPLESAAAALSNPQLDKRRVIGFAQGLDHLKDLHRRLTTMVPWHDSWQVLDNRLRLIDSNLGPHDSSELADSWPDIKAHMGQLVSGTDEGTAGDAEKAEAELDTALNGREPACIRRCFDTYRQHAGHRFHCADQRLRWLCDELLQAAPAVDEFIQLLGQG